MSTQQIPLTYEGVLASIRESREEFREIREQMKETDRRIERMFQETRQVSLETDRKFQETDRKFQETDRKFQETDRKIKETNKQISSLGGRIGDIIVEMVRGNVVEKFHALGYDVTECRSRKPFKNKKLELRGEIDLFLYDGDDEDDGDIAVLIEVKTTLETADVREHIERLEKYRQYLDVRGNGAQRCIGAVAGAVVNDNAAKLAQENGMYVIVQSGDAVEIVTPPEGFRAKEW